MCLILSSTIALPPLFFGEIRWLCSRRLICSFKGTTSMRAREELRACTGLLIGLEPSWLGNWDHEVLVADACSDGRVTTGSLANRRGAKVRQGYWHGSRSASPTSPSPNRRLPLTSETVVASTCISAKSPQTSSATDGGDREAGTA